MSARPGPELAPPRDEYPLPDTEWAPLREFWAAAERGELAIPRCDDCGAYTWYPRPACAACGSAAQSWRALSGRGRLYSWAVVERALAAPFRDKLPYVAALVALEEDPAVRLVTNVVDCDPATLRADQPLRVVFRPLRFEGRTREVMAPMFAPTAGE